MLDVTVGLYEVDSRMYYIDEYIVILDNPSNGIPTLVVRHPVKPRSEGASMHLLEMKMRRAMKEVGMVAVGEQYTRPDGLICQELKEASNGKE